MVTLKDVATRAGVSTATVSYVLNGTGSVSPEVAARILEAVEALGYRPNRSARALRTGQSRTLGLVLPDLTNPFFPELAQAVEHAARMKGYAVILIDSREEAEVEEQGFMLLAEYGVEGAIWCPISAQIPARPSSPTVVIDRPIEGFDLVRADVRRGGALIAEYALELGHQRVGLISGPQHLASARLRREGFLEVARGHLEVVWEVEVAFSRKLNEKAVAVLQANEASLIVAANDTLAIGALNVLHTLGKRVPEEVSLLGFDDIPWAELVYPSLSTVKQPLTELGSKAVSLLHRRLHEPDLPLQQLLLDVKLIVRNSARAVHGWD